MNQSNVFKKLACPFRSTLDTTSKITFMHSETFYKIGGALQFLTAIFAAFYYKYSALQPVTEEILNFYPVGLYYVYIVFLLYSGITNLLIGRSGMPLRQYRLFSIINIATWVIICLINLFYLWVIVFYWHLFILLAFTISFFTKPKFQ